MFSLGLDLFVDEPMEDRSKEPGVKSNYHAYYGQKHVVIAVLLVGPYPQIKKFE